MNLKRILASFVSVTVAAASFYAAPLTLAASDEFDTVTELRLAAEASREVAVALLENDTNFIAGGQADADTPNYNFQADFTADDGVRFGWPDACQVSTTESLENYRFSARFRNHASLQWAGISVRDNANTLCTENTTVIAEEPEPDGNPHAQVIGASTQGIVFMNNAPHADQHNFAVAVRKADDAQKPHIILKPALHKAISTPKPLCALPTRRMKLFMKPRTGVWRDRFGSVHAPCESYAGPEFEKCRRLLHFRRGV